MDIREAINRIREHQEIHQNKEPMSIKINSAIDLAIQALEEKVFFENTVNEISDWFVNNKDCLLDMAQKVAKNGFKEVGTDGYVDDVDLDFIVEEIVDETQKGILNVLSTFKHL